MTASKPKKSSKKRSKKKCPAHHIEYLSQQLADNAVFLHQTKNTLCKSIHVFPCGDHWHIGHRHHKAGDMCKSDEYNVDQRMFKQRRLAEKNMERQGYLKGSAKKKRV